MAVKPLEDRVLFKPIEGESMTASGIYLPESAKEKPDLEVQGGAMPGMGGICGGMPRMCEMGF